jgi:hypothetical protein
MVYFPELFGKSNDKFGRLAIWLVTHEAVVCPNVRDLFSAGGRDDYKVYKNVPRIFLNLFENISIVVETINQTSALELSEYWKTHTTEKSKLLDWINLVTKHSKTNHLNIKEILTELALT